MGRLNDHGIKVTLISGNALWMGKKNHSCGHFVFSDLGQVGFQQPKSSMFQGLFHYLKNKKRHCALCHAVSNGATTGLCCHFFKVNALALNEQLVTILTQQFASLPSLTLNTPPVHSFTQQPIPLFDRSHEICIAWSRG